MAMPSGSVMSNLHPHLRLSLWIVVALALLLFISCDSQQTAPGVAQPRLEQLLPAIGSLDGAEAVKLTAGTKLVELLDTAPYLQAEAGVSYTPGSLSLTPGAPPEFSWAIFALGGFPEDRSIFPLAVAVEHDAPCWLALSNYKRDTWRFYRLDGSETSAYSLPDGENLISPSGVFYAALIAYGNSVSCSSLQVTTTGVPAPGDWWMLGHDAQHTHRSSFVGPASPNLKWSFRTTGPGFNFTDAAVAPDGTVYIGSGPELHALNPDGTEKWRYNVHWPNRRPVLAGDGAVCVVSNVKTAIAVTTLSTAGGLLWSRAYERYGPDAVGAAADGTVYLSFGGTVKAYALDGTEKWTSPPLTGVVSSIIVDARGVLFCVNGTAAIALNADGSKKWEYPLGTSTQRTLAVDAQSNIYVGGYDNSLYALNSLGHLLWSYTAEDAVKSIVIDETAKTLAFSYGSCAVGSLALDGELLWKLNIDGSSLKIPCYLENHNLIVCTYDGVIFRISPEGEVLWKKSAADTIFSSPVLGKTGDCYFSTIDSDFHNILWAMEENGVQRWSFTTGYSVLCAPAIGADGSIYFGSRDCNVYALKSDGTKKWSVPTGGIVSASPAIGSDGVIYFSSTDGCLYALSAWGDIKWKYETSGALYSSPVIAPDGTVYVGSEDTCLYAFKKDGSFKWLVPTGGELRSSPALDSAGVVYIGCTDGKLYVVNPDGTVKWTYATPAAISSSPAIGADGKIYIASDAFDFALYVINPDGTLNRRIGTDAGLTTDPVVGADGGIRFGGRYNFCSLNPDGTQQWASNFTGFIQSTPAIDADDNAYFGCEDRSLYSVAPGGAVRWSFATDGQVYGSPAIGPDGTLYFGSDDGSLYAVGPGS
jgi:outer membrane protein assembly factor BamB